jgi:hypothetical protein
MQAPSLAADERCMVMRTRRPSSVVRLLTCSVMASAGSGHECKWQWESTQTDPDATKDAVKIDFLDSGMVAKGFTIASRFAASSSDNMGLVSQCSCKCGTAPEKVPAHSGMLVAIQGGHLSFVGSSKKWMAGPPVPVGQKVSSEVSFTPDAAADAQTGTLSLAVDGVSKSYTGVTTPGGFGPYHYPWRVGWSGGGGVRCRDHASGEDSKMYDCGPACNQFKGAFSYTALVMRGGTPASPPLPRAYPRHLSCAPVR